MQPLGQKQGMVLSRIVQAAWFCNDGERETGEGDNRTDREVGREQLKLAWAVAPQGGPHQHTACDDSNRAIRRPFLFDRQLTPTCK